MTQPTFCQKILLIIFFLTNFSIETMKNMRLTASLW